MAPTREPAAHRGRRFPAARAVMAAACLITATAFVGGTITAHAEPLTGSVPAPRQAPGPPLADPSPGTCPPLCPLSPSPTPAVIEVSPVPPDPIPAPTTPSYLQGLNKSPSPTPSVNDSNSSPLPVVGGFVDQASPPSAGDSVAAGSVASTGAPAPRSSGPPLPLLAVGALLVLGAIGALIFAVTPRNKRIFDAPRRPPAPRPGPEGDA